MASLKRINPSSSSRLNNDTGFGTNADSYGGRFINRDGTFNLRKEGKPFWERVNVFHTLLNLPLWKFIGMIVIFYIGINVLYTGIYMLVGMDQLEGMEATTTW